MTFRGELEACARAAGFDALGVASVEPFAREEAAIHARVDAGYYRGLPWFTRERTWLSCYPERHLEGARSLISLATRYDTRGGLPPAGAGPCGRISNYAWSGDYHRTIGGRLQTIKAFLAARGFRARSCVDTSPMVDRAAAVRAGVGFYGKHTNVIHPQLGSYVFLAEVVTDAPLEPDPPSRRGCGACSACLPACPTGAIVAPYVVDNQRCISYLTIEHRGPIPRELRPLMGTWIFGCDLCQEACPITRRRPPAARAEWQPLPGLGPLLALEPLLALDEAGFRARFGRTPIARAKRQGLLRNAAIALGNTGDPAAVPALVRCLETEADPVIRGAAAWALGQLGGPLARGSLEGAFAIETDPAVREELRTALEARSRGPGLPARPGH